MRDMARWVLWVAAVLASHFAVETAEACSIAPANSIERAWPNGSDEPTNPNIILMLYQGNGGSRIELTTFNGRPVPTTTFSARDNVNNWRGELGWITWQILQPLDALNHSEVYQV